MSHEVKMPTDTEIDEISVDKLVELREKILLGELDILPVVMGLSEAIITDIRYAHWITIARECLDDPDIWMKAGARLARNASRPIVMVCVSGTWSNQEDPNDSRIWDLTIASSVASADGRVASTYCLVDLQQGPPARFSDTYHVNAHDPAEELQDLDFKVPSLEVLQGYLLGMQSQIKGMN